MKEFAGKTAFVTGGASGIGYAMAQAFLAEGMNVMLADIEEEALAKAVADLGATNAQLRTLVCDVAVREAVNEAAEKTVSEFGKVHIVCNNAGIGAGGPMGEIAASDWDWTIAVDQWGVAYGIEAFLPHLKAHGEQSHIVNTASMAGMVGVPNMGPYCAAKFAVVAMSECLNAELADTNIGVSVLCPAFVKTRIHESGRTRQAKFGGPRDQAIEVANNSGEDVAALVNAGIDPSAVAGRVLECIRDEELYVFTHPESWDWIAERFGNIERAFESAKASPALRGQS